MRSLRRRYLWIVSLAGAFLVVGLAAIVLYRPLLLEWHVAQLASTDDARAGRSARAIAELEFVDGLEPLVRWEAEHCEADRDESEEGRDSSPAGRLATALPPRDSLRILLPLLQDPEVPVRCVAISSIRAMGTDAAPALPELLRCLDREADALPLGWLEEDDAVGEPDDAWVHRLFGVVMEFWRARPDASFFRSVPDGMSRPARVGFAMMAQVGSPDLMFFSYGTDPVAHLRVLESLHGDGRVAAIAATLAVYDWPMYLEGKEWSRNLSLLAGDPRDAVTEFLWRALAYAADNWLWEGNRAVEELLGLLQPELCRALDRESPPLRVAVMGCLSHLPDPPIEAMPSIVRAVQEGGLVARLALRTLANYGRRAAPAAPAVLTSIEEWIANARRERSLRASASEIVAFLRSGAVENPAAVSVLVGMLRAMDPSDHETNVDAGDSIREVLGAIGALGPDAAAAAPVLSRRFDRRYDAYWSLEILGGIGPAAARFAPAVIEAMASHDYVRRGGGVALRATRRAGRPGDGRAPDFLDRFEGAGAVLAARFPSRARRRSPSRIRSSKRRRVVAGDVRSGA